jgi:hypothetical protein
MLIIEPSTVNRVVRNEYVAFHGLREIPSFVGSCIKLFADDSKIWRSLVTAVDGRKLQRDISILHDGQKIGYSGSMWKSAKL